MTSQDSKASPDDASTETIKQLRDSFFYGSRSNLNFKFVSNLTDGEFGEFLAELFEALESAVNDGDPATVVETINFWQVEAHAGKHVGESTFQYQYDDIPIAQLSKPLSECRVVLLTSSGHFVEGADPEPFGVVDMTQHQAEARIMEFLKETPTLSSIPMDTPADQVRLRHPGYPTKAALSDHRVNLPLEHLQALVGDGTIASVLPNAYSFVGAASQLKLKKNIAPVWADRLRDEGADLALLVPV